MKELRLALTTIKIRIKDQLHYPGRFFTDIVVFATRCGILLVLYWYVFKLRGGTISGTTFQAVAWSMFFYFTFMTFRLRDISREMMMDVQTGQIETLMNKPISYLSYKAWGRIGTGILPMLTVGALGATALTLTVGAPPLMRSAAFFPTLALVFIGSCSLTIAVYTIVGLLSFWIEDINPVFWMVDKAVMMLGGSYLPIALFPSLMYKIAVFSPFGASQFLTHTAYAKWLYEWPMLIGIQAAWIVLLGTTMLIMYKYARKTVCVNGG